MSPNFGFLFGSAGCPDGVLPDGVGVSINSLSGCGEPSGVMDDVRGVVPQVLCLYGANLAASQVPFAVMCLSSLNSHMARFVAPLSFGTPVFVILTTVRNQSIVNLDQVVGTSDI